MIVPSPQVASDFLAHHSFIWHQRWEIAPGVFTPGLNDIAWLMSHLGVPRDLSGLSVLDIGATNAAAAFEAERRGASRVVAVDLFDADHYGVRSIREVLDSRLEYRRGSVYDLSSILDDQFDVVFFFGVLYHLRHPLLALDQVNAACGDYLFIETASDSHLASPQQDDVSYARFFRQDELAGDPSNWFAPNKNALRDWLASCGFDLEHLDEWPISQPTRAGARCKKSSRVPEWQELSYERPLQVRPLDYPSKW